MLTVGLLSGLAVTSVGTLMAFRSPAKATKQNSNPAAATMAMLTKATTLPEPALVEHSQNAFKPALANAAPLPPPQPENCMNDVERSELRKSVAEVVKGMDKTTIMRLLMNLPTERNVTHGELRTLIAQLPTDKQPHAEAMVLAVALYPKELPVLMQTLKAEMTKQNLGYATGSVPSNLQPKDQTDMVLTARSYWATDPECDPDLKEKLTDLIRTSIQTASLEVKK